MFVGKAASLLRTDNQQNKLIARDQELYSMYLWELVVHLEASWLGIEELPVFTKEPFEKIIIMEYGSPEARSH